MAAEAEELSAQEKEREKPFRCHGTSFTGIAGR